MLAVCTSVASGVFFVKYEYGGIFGMTTILPMEGHKMALGRLAGQRGGSASSRRDPTLWRRMRDMRKDCEMLFSRKNVYGASILTRKRALISGIFYAVHAFTHART